MIKIYKDSTVLASLEDYSVVQKTKLYKKKLETETIITLFEPNGLEDVLNYSDTYDVLVDLGERKWFKNLKRYEFNVLFDEPIIMLSGI